MVEGRGRARLLLEALLAVRVGRELRRQNLDGHVAPQPRVARPIHLSHASGAQGERISKGPSLVPAATVMSVSRAREQMRLPLSRRSAREAGR